MIRCSFCDVSSEDVAIMFRSDAVAICDECVQACVGVMMDSYRRKNKLQKMPYRDYLVTREWSDIRKQVLQAAGFKCQVCNSDQDLNVHHRTYERRGREQLSDLTVLCRDCHELFHSNGNLAEKPKAARSKSADRSRLSAVDWEDLA